MDAPPDDLLERVRALGAAEDGLAVVVTLRPDASPHASVVNAGVVPHPLTAEPVIGFVVRGARLKLRHLRERPQATVVFRSGWEWIAVDGQAEIVGPDDELAGFDPTSLPDLLARVYAAAAGGTPEDWAGMHEIMTAERHSAVLVRPERVYPQAADA